MKYRKICIIVLTILLLEVLPSCSLDKTNDNPQTEIPSNAVSTKTYSITYDLNGGINSDLNPSSYQINDNILLAEPTKIGYEFNGWTLNGNKITTISGYNSDLTLVANWTPMARESSYITDLSKVDFISKGIINNDDWYLQYPSGTVEGGACYAYDLSETKNKYASYYTDKNNNSYIRVSLDSTDKGSTSKNVNIRTEFKTSKAFTLADNTSFEYSFYITSTDIENTKFTIGQIMTSIPEFGDKPILRIEYANGELMAMIQGYYYNQEFGSVITDNITEGVTKENYPLSFDENGNFCTYEKNGMTLQHPVKKSLGELVEYQKVNIKLELKNGRLMIYRDNNLIVNYIYSEKVDKSNVLCYKAGIYNGTKDIAMFMEAFFDKFIYTKY